MGAIRFSGILVKLRTLLTTADDADTDCCCGSSNVEVDRCCANTRLDHNGSKSNEDITRLFTNYKKKFNQK